MSRAVSMRPDLYAAYLHGASQWDGDYAPIAEKGVAVYIYMAESDEYYGSANVVFDYSEPLITFLLDYLSVMGLFVAISYCVNTLLVTVSKA